jgi:TPR repeat protein
MGFKRTTEGRVFFQGADNTANDQPPAIGGANTQIQILSLLRALNEKLQDTQADRRKMRQELETYRAMVDNLQNKSRQSEEAFKDLTKKIQQSPAADPRTLKVEQLAQELAKELEETRKLMLDLEDKADKADKGVIMLNTHIGQTRNVSDELNRKQAALEQEQKALAAKLEENFTQQEKLSRKVDKAIEDRARFMRKIERIEETVIQTRDALNAKAMVLLTNGQAQNEGASMNAAFDPPLSAPAFTAPATALGAATLTELPPSLDSQAKVNPGDAYLAAIAGASWWQKRIKLEAVAIICIIIACVLVGWLISEVQKPQLAELPPLNEMTGLAEPRADQPQENLAEADLAAPPAASGATDISAQENAAPEEWTSRPPQGQFSEALPIENNPQENAAPAALDRTMNDLGAIDLNDEEKVARLLEENPDAVATALNNLEPSSLPPQNADTSSPVRMNPVSTSDFKPDARLPEMVQAIEKQAFDGLPAAQHDLAAIYTAGHGGVKQNYDRAIFWFEQAAKRGVANAAYNLGVLHHQGLGTKADIGKAINWYNQAAGQGHPEAQYNLGIAYIEGIGVPYDAVKAASYFRSAADQGIMEAAYNLGLIYENGLLGKPEPDTALMWYQTAADKGSPEAKAALDQLAKTLGIKPEDVKRLVQKLPQAGSSLNENRAALAPPPLPLGATALATNGQRAMLSEIQDYLMQEGLYPGPADGFDGPQTLDAIRTYQAANDLTVDGKPSQSLLEHMRTQISGTP